MAFKSPTQPLCRYCGRAIRKRTELVRFGRAPCEVENSRGSAERPANRAEAQRYVNGQVVAVRYSTAAHEDAERGSDGATWSRSCGATTAYRNVTVARYVDEASVWDGESYEDEFFCTGEHAKLFGYACAMEGSLSMKAWREAVAAQRERRP